MTIYKFKSKVTGDLIMLAPQGDRLLQLLGREPVAKGIFEVAAMPGLLQRLEAALAEDGDEAAAVGEAAAEPAVGLRQRLWPMIEMLRRCHAAGEPIVWGV